VRGLSDLPFTVLVALPSMQKQYYDCGEVITKGCLRKHIHFKAPKNNGDSKKKEKENAKKNPIAAENRFITICFINIVSYKIERLRSKHKNYLILNPLIST
jgi:hypothetical protein